MHFQVLTMNWNKLSVVLTLKRFIFCLVFSWKMSTSCTKINRSCSVLFTWKKTFLIVEQFGWHKVWDSVRVECSMWIGNKLLPELEGFVCSCSGVRVEWSGSWADRFVWSQLWYRVLNWSCLSTFLPSLLWALRDGCRYKLRASFEVCWALP